MSDENVFCFNFRRNSAKNWVTVGLSPRVYKQDFEVHVCKVQCVMLQRTNATTNSFHLSKIRMLQRAPRNTIGQRSTRVRMTCRAFPLRLECQSLSLLSFVRFSYRFSSVICLFVQRVKVKYINFILFYAYIFDFVLYFSCLNGCVGW